MKEKLISNLKNSFSYKGFKLVKEDGALKINEVRYKFTENNELQLKYQNRDHDDIIELLTFFTLFHPKTKLNIVNAENNSTGYYLWLRF